MTDTKDLRDENMVTSEQIDDALTELEEDDDRDDDENEYLGWLVAFREAGKSHPRWRTAMLFIRAEHWSTYVRDFAEGMLGQLDEWPCTCIDWDRAADALMADYTTYVIEGEDWYARS